MVEEPQVTTNLLKRGNELNFLSSSNPSPPVQEGEATDEQLKPTIAPVPVLEKSNVLYQQFNRKLLARQQSITRGTASSLAKAVRPNLNDTTSTTTTPTNAEAIIKRKLSATFRTRKQSLTATTQQPAAIVENKQLLNVGILPSNANGQRRSSWSPPHQSQTIAVVVPELPSSPSSSPSPPIRKVFEARRRASVIPTNRTTAETNNTTTKTTTITTTSPPPKNNIYDSSIVITSSNNADNKLLLQKRPSKYSAVNMNTDDGNHPNKADEINNNNAASTAGNQQQTPCSNSSFSLADAFVVNEAPVASNAPNVIADEVITIRRPLSSSSSSSSSSSLGRSHHHHNHTHNSEDDHLPSYMRRPICAACNRNVKVTSSSESTNAAAAAGGIPKSISTANSSRRSSFSTTATTTSKSHEGGNNKKRISTHGKLINNEHQDVTINPISATSSLSTIGSNHSIQSMISSSSSSNSSGSTSTSSSSSSSSNSNHPNLHGLTGRALRSHSPTSPIPTRRRTKKKSTLANNLTIMENPCSTSSDNTIISKPSNQLIEKWSQLLSQQQLLLATIGGGNINGDDDEELNSIQQNIAKLVTSNKEQYETVLLETQAKILQKFTLLMMQQHQQQQKQQQQQQQQQKQKDALLFLSSSSTKTLPFGVSGSVATITPINIYNEHNHNTIDTAITNNNNNITDLSLTPNSSHLKSSNWQTKLEYGVTRFKWNMSQWIGNIVGTGDIEEQDFDTLGYPKNVIISGVCVTTEPGLLPKGLQKYFKPHQQLDQVICHKYIIQLSRQSRLTKFQLLNQNQWVQDDHVKKCQFKIQDRHDYIKRTKHCEVEFGIFQRRHHCRSCGHVFCQEHSSNKLPLFVSNGQDCGEWARVCDACFYSRIEPQLLTRS